MKTFEISSNKALTIAKKKYRFVSMSAQYMTKR